MNRAFTYSLLIIFSLLLTLPAIAQDFNGTWTCDYSTYDNSDNGTGYNTIAAGVVNENNFVALVYTDDNVNNYLVGYSNADSANGKLGNIPYTPDYRRTWSYVFSAVEMSGAVDLAATPDSLIYVANNDPKRNILVFKLGADSVESTQYRLETRSDSLWAIDVDSQGRVYVTVEKDSVTPGEVYVYNGIKDAESDWSSPNYTGTPITKITLPEPGSYRGLTVNSDGKVLYVSNFTTRKIYCYTGDPTTGYTLNNDFNFMLQDTLRIDSVTSYVPGPIGLQYMNDKNILFVACHFDFLRGDRYNYGRVYALNPNTGAILDTIDCAQWNYDVTGGYNLRSSGMVPNASGYTSPYNVAFDENDNVYIQSYFGWAVDKWSYSGTLPTIPLTIIPTDVKKANDLTPGSFSLSQNYPNPFNPTTTIKFSLNKSSNVTLSIYDINGRLVSKLINSEHYSSGNYDVTFDASKLASGTYIYVLRTNTRQLSRKMTLIK